MEVVVATAAIRCAKPQSNHHQQTTAHFLWAKCHSCCPTKGNCKILLVLIYLERKRCILWHSGRASRASTSRSLSSGDGRLLGRWQRPLVSTGRTVSWLWSWSAAGAASRTASSFTACVILLTQQFPTPSNDNHDKCLTAVFQDNLRRPAPECLHSGFYWSKENGGDGDNWSYQTCKAPVKLAPQQTNTQLFTGWMPFLSPDQYSIFR